jgi:hypothetical protein
LIKEITTASSDYFEVECKRIIYVRKPEYETKENVIAKYLE